MFYFDEVRYARALCSKVNDRLEFRGILKTLRVHLSALGTTITARLAWGVPDAADSRGRVTDIGRCLTVDVCNFVDDIEGAEGRLIELVRMAVWELMAHELDEGFWVDGSYHRDPHPEQNECTGVAARWCPVHGDCSCRVDSDSDWRRTLTDETCPLHGPSSSHAS